MRTYLHFWAFCAVTLAASLPVCWLGYRLKSMDLGLGKLSREIGTVACVAAAEAVLLFLTFRTLHWTHWLQYMVVVVVGGLGYRLTHVNEMDEYQPFAIAIVQFFLFWPSVKLMEQVFGQNLARRFPLVP